MTWRDRPPPVGEGWGWGTLAYSLLAGLLAGLVTAGFHFVATEPLIEAAIAFEEGSHTEPLLVSRSVQQAGLALGYAIYGLTWGLLFGGAFLLAHQRLPGRSPARRVWALAALAYWTVGLLPLLKYPANPPGVGDPETITYRQVLYVAFLLLSLLSAAVALAQAGRDGHRWLPALALLGVASGALLFGMPASADPVLLPEPLVAGFRLRAVAGTTLFWIVVAATFGWLIERERSTQSASAPIAEAHAR